MRELAQLWLAPTADALHRVLVMHQAIRGSSDAFEPFLLLQKHHETEPATSVVTAMLLLTDRRWRGGTGQLVRRIAQSGILDREHLDVLAEVFLAADDAVFWEVPDEWFGDDAIVIELADLGSGEPDGPDDGSAAVEPDDLEAQRPAVARREVAPPLRRWAAAWEAARVPESWAALVARAQELGRRDAAAIVAGLLDAIELLAPPVQALLIKEATTWPDRSVRRLGLGLLAERGGSEVASRLAQDDPDATIRTWAESLKGTPPSVDTPRSQGTVRVTRAPRARADEPPTLF